MYDSKFKTSIHKFVQCVKLQTTKSTTRPVLRNVQGYAKYASLVCTVVNEMYVLHSISKQDAFIKWRGKYFRKRSRTQTHSAF